MSLGYSHKPRDYWHLAVKGCQLSAIPITLSQSLARNSVVLYELGSRESSVESSIRMKGRDKSDFYREFR